MIRLPFAIVIFVLVGIILGIGYALWQVYPFGIAHPDTGIYLQEGLSLSWKTLTPYDAFRPPLFPLLLRLATHAPEPSVAVYWAHMILFAINIALAAVLTRILFGSVTTAFFAGLGLLLLEFFPMWTLFYSTQLLSDPLYAHLLFAAVMCILIGVTSGRRPVIVLGFFLVGLLPLVRMIGAAQLLLWTCVLLGVLIWQTRCFRRRESGAFLLVCLVSLVMPFLLWNIRNTVLSGSWHGNEMKGSFLLYRTHELISDDMRLLDDSVANAELHDMIKQMRKNNESSVDIAVAILNAAVTAEGGQYGYSYSVVDSKAGIRMAFRILKAAPLSYVRLVYHDYKNFFSPSWLHNREYIYYRANPAILYDPMRDDMRPNSWLVDLYPNGFPDKVQFNHSLASIFAEWSTESRFAQWRTVTPSLFWVIHIGILLLGRYAWHRREALFFRCSSASITFAMCLILITACWNLLISAAVTQQEPRFAMPSSMLVHFTVVLFALLIGRSVSSIWHRGCSC